MTETILFPGLGFAVEVNRVAFTIAGRPIYWYGILFGLGFIAAALYIIRRVKAFGLDADRMIDVLLGTVIGGLVGARLYYVAFSWENYKDNLLKIFNVREGGIAIYGGIIGAALAAYLMCRLRKVRFIPLCDLFFGGLILAQAIGRWGNFINVEAFGSPTTLPWGMTSDSIVRYLNLVGIEAAPGTLVHPTFFYESAWCLLGFVLLALLTGRRRYDGQLSLVYLGWYGLGRFFIEGLRTDSLMAGSVRVSQVVAALCVLASIALLIRNHLRIKASDDPAFMQLYVNTEEGQAILAGTFYPKKKKDAEEEAGGNDAAEAQEDALSDGDGAAEAVEDAPSDGDGGAAEAEEDAPSDEDGGAAEAEKDAPSDEGGGAAEAQEVTSSDEDGGAEDKPKGR